MAIATITATPMTEPTITAGGVLPGQPDDPRRPPLGGVGGRVP
jgi:hypothetical protein